MKLYCAMCRSEKDEKEFTKFSRNPNLKDRNGRTPLCRDCASEYVEQRGNTLDALKEVLRLQDIPFIEKYGISALESYEKKKKGTNVIIKKNVYDNEEEIQGIENTTLQTTIYTCYSSNLGIMPKDYTNFSHSDGIRDDSVVSVSVKANDESDKVVNSAIRFLKKTYTDDIYNDKERLAKAVKISMDELSLHKNNNTKRQTKFKLKNHIIALIEAGQLDKSDYEFIFDGDESKQPEDIMETPNVSEATVEGSIDIPDDMNINDLRVKWGDEFKDKEIVKFENKYRDLRKNYEIKTSAHDEFLKLACVASVRGQECMAKNDVDGAKTWMGMFKDLTSAGKLQPQQMSKADLSGGLSNFGEFFKSIEQAKGVIEILPVFKKAPKDDADFVIYCLVQYVRRLKGLPDIKYEDIWKFYDEFAQSFQGDDDNDFVSDMLNEIDEDMLEDEVGEDEHDE